MGINVSFKNFVVEHDGEEIGPIDLNAPSGSFTAIEVANEHISSALMMTVAMFVEHYSGSATMDGEEISSISQSDRMAIRSRTGIVSASMPLISNLKLIENVYLPHFYHDNANEKECFRNAYTLLEKFGIADKYASPPAYLSQHERRLAALARTWLSDPDLVFVSMPFKNIEGDKQTAMAKSIRELHSFRSGRTTLLTFSPGDDINELIADNIIRR